MFDEIKKFEDNLELLDFRFKYKDTLIWPYIRYAINLHGELHITNNYPTGKNDNSRKTPYLKILKSAWTWIIKNPYVAKQYPVLIFSSDVYNVVKKEGKFFNRLHDYYALLKPEDTLLIEKSKDYNHTKPRYNKNLRYRDIIDLEVIIKRKMSGVNNSDILTIDSFTQYLKSKYPIKFSQEFYDKLNSILISYSQSLKPLDHCYSRIFEKIKPKIIFFDDASYGSLHASVMRCANERHIVTAEFQHGYVGSTHWAYFHSKKLCKNKEYSSYYPKLFLTFGDYWNNNIQIPGEKIVIGNPHVFEKISGASKDKKINNSILFISGGLFPENIDLMGNITKRFMKIIKDRKEEYKIVYKLHPKESKIYNKYLEYFAGFNNIQVVKDRDIHELMAQCEVIVGEDSTALFEALLYTENIFVYESIRSRLAISKELGTWFKDESELYNLLVTGTCNNQIKDYKTFWEPNWKQNYLNLLKKYI